MELLSPAGSFEALHAAVSSGADAVYFGGNLFNARLGAKNFDNDEMLSALDFCHINGVKAYITMNTLTHDRDLNSAVDFAAFLYEHGADALIIQDFGLYSLLKKHIPNFELHASTQMCISTLDGVKKCEDLGFSRVVLSRELSLSDISHIHNNSNMPLEVFVHGAMCMSFSGGCLFSSMVGGRSGNCGTCAQPCRKYAAIDKMPKYDDLALSLSDLCMIEHIKELEKVGVVSLKIEGRMKKPSYIASVTHAYRRAIDGASPSEIQRLKREMYEVFNRGEFSTGYFFGDNAHINRIATANPSQDTLSAINSRPSLCQQHNISMGLSVHPQNAAELKVTSELGSFTIIGDIVQTAQKPITPSTVLRYIEQLKKLGGTNFTAQDVTADITGFLSVSSINEMRRAAVSKLNELYSIRRKPPQIPTNLELKKSSFYNTNICSNRIIVKVMNISQAYAAHDAGADEITLEYGAFSKADVNLLQSIRNDVQLNLSLPISLIGEAEDIILRNNVNAADFDGIEINNLGQIEYAQLFDRIIGGIHLNVFNAHTAHLLLNMGIERLTLSPELNPAQVREIMRFIPADKLSLQVFGRIVLMNLYHCPIKESMGCDKCKAKWHTLYDVEGRAFPIVGTQKKHPCSVVRLYNCFAHDLMPKLSNVQGLNYLLSFTDESAEIVQDRIFAAKSNSKAALANTTRGYFR